MNFKEIMLPKVPRLLALVGLGLTALVSRHLIARFAISPELATVLADYVAELVLGLALVGIGWLKLDDNKKVKDLLASERAKVEQEIAPKKAARHG